VPRPPRALRRLPPAADREPLIAALVRGIGVECPVHVVAGGQPVAAAVAASRSATSELRFVNFADRDWRILSSAPSGASMNKIYPSAVWAPEVLGKDRIDQCRWAYAVQAPFDMPADMPGLVGAKVQLDGAIFDVRGFVPRMPSSPILQGEAIELLVRSAATDRP
jgi:hypothetical protein